MRCRLSTKLHQSVRIADMRIHGDFSPATDESTKAFNEQEHEGPMLLLRRQWPCVES